jgi:hypothetical protein
MPGIDSHHPHAAKIAFWAEASTLMPAFYTPPRANPSVTAVLPIFSRNHPQSAGL